MYAIQLIIVILKHPLNSNTEMIMNRQNQIYVKKTMSHRVCLLLLLATIILINLEQNENSYSYKRIDQQVQMSL